MRERTNVVVLWSPAGTLIDTVTKDIYIFFLRCDEFNGCINNVFCFGVKSVFGAREKHPGKITLGLDPNYGAQYTGWSPFSHN